MEHSAVEFKRRNEDNAEDKASLDCETGKKVQEHILLMC